MRFRRILLKLSGEALMGEVAYGIDPKVVLRIAQEVKEVHDLGVEVALVVGGGNIFRGLQASATGMDRASADYMGMLATVMNAIALQDALESLHCETRLLTAIRMESVAEPYIRRRAIRHLEKGRIVILAGGTGNPYMTTDTAAALRAVEIDADVLLMAKHGVDGVYDADPRTTPGARKYAELSYLDALNQRLAVMDATALSLCMDNALPIVVFDLSAEDSIFRAMLGEPLGTLVHQCESVYA